MALYAASTDDVETNTAFAKKLELGYPILSDVDRSVARAFGVLIKEKYAARVTFYIGKDGKVLYVDDEVSPNTAGQDILERLRTLGVIGGGE